MSFDLVDWLIERFAILFKDGQTKDKSQENDKKRRHSRVLAKEKSPSCKENKQDIQETAS